MNLSKLKYIAIFTVISPGIGALIAQIFDLNIGDSIGTASIVGFALGVAVTFAAEE